MKKNNPGDQELIKPCIRCGQPSRFDICEPCSELMRDLSYRQWFYEFRYSSYVVDHGMAEFDFVEKYLHPDCFVLEIGAGAGHLSNHCKKYTQNVVTLDFSIHMIKASKKKYPQLDVCIADAEKFLPFKDASFDVVVCSEVFEHFYNVTRNIQEMHRILKKQGIYIIKTPNKTIEYFYNMLMHKNTYYHKSFHPSTQSKMSLQSILIEQGFQPVFIHQKRLSDTQKNKIAWIPAIKFIECILKHLPCGLSPSLICIARKSLLVQN